LVARTNHTISLEANGLRPTKDCIFKTAFIPRFLMEFAFLGLNMVAFCQQVPSSPPAPTAPNQTANRPAATTTEIVVVTGTFEPIPLSQTNRSVVVLDTNEQPLLFNSLVDYLKNDPSLDLQQRGLNGVQVDLSIRGSTFEQSLVLLNGLRINDAQTGHHDMDIPVPLDALSRIEILHGAGSTLYGADAMGGAVNLITATPARTELRALVGAGNFGFNQQRADLSYVGGHFSEQVVGSRDFSTGFRPDRDYRSSSVSSETRFETEWGKTNLLLAGGDRPFGADQFYGNFPSWERTKSWFGSLAQQINKDTSLAFGYRRHSDEFVLVRDDPSLYENNHVSQSWQAALRRSNSWRDLTFAYGLDADWDQIDSNNLGRHARNRTAGYLNLDLQRFQRLFLSVGAREELFSGGRAEFAPAVAGAFFLGQGLRLRVSVSRGFRLPTYTDLYYSDPANLGNPLLKPESAWDFEGGPEWSPDGKVSLQATVFHRREHNDIDYVRSSPTAPWQATNINYIAFTGFEASVQFKLPKGQQIMLAYTALTASQQLQPGLTSKYVFNYPSHNAVFSWMGQVKQLVSLRTRVGATQRVGQSAYALWDFAASPSGGRIRPYLQLSNLSNTGYEEIPGVTMPGRSILGGVQFVLLTRDRH
jgi:outer membrane cobalamin receptor